jgi:CRP-like cAMP-binding protein
MLSMYMHLEGDFFGERGMVQELRLHSADVVVSSSALTVLVMSRSDFRLLIVQRRALYNTIMTRMGNLVQEDGDDGVAEEDVVEVARDAQTDVGSSYSVVEDVQEEKTASLDGLFP